jgi:predicted TIM-barrel fold metal-dependent hydrolase
MFLPGPALAARPRGAQSAALPAPGKTVRQLVRKLLVSDAPLVDCHAHIWTSDMPRVPNSRHPLGYDFTLEQYLKALDEHGVKLGVIAAASPFGDYNDYTIECLRRTPRLRGTVTLAPDAGRYEMEGMARDGVVGLRLNLLDRDTLPDLGSFEYQRLLRRVRDLNWHVHLHVEGHKLPGLLPGLEAAGVKIVIDHIGRPGPADTPDSPGYQAMQRAIARGRTWVKLSGAYRIGGAAKTHAVALLRDAGPERLVWASDCPFAGHEGRVTYRETIEWLADCVPDPEARRKIFGETAIGLYFS